MLVYSGSVASPGQAAWIPVIRRTRLDQAGSLQKQPVIVRKVRPRCCGLHQELLIAASSRRTVKNLGRPSRRERAKRDIAAMTCENQLRAEGGEYEAATPEAIFGKSLNIPNFRAFGLVD